VWLALALWHLHSLSLVLPCATQPGQAIQGSNTGKKYLVTAAAASAVAPPCVWLALVLWYIVPTPVLVMLPCASQQGQAMQVWLTRSEGQT
jgi:hypothetical protein